MLKLIIEALEYDNSQLKLENQELHNEIQHRNKIFNEIIFEINSAIEQNLDVMKQRKAKGYKFGEDTFLHTIDGKISALRGMLYFIETIRPNYLNRVRGVSNDK